MAQMAEIELGNKHHFLLLVFFLWCWLHSVVMKCHDCIGPGLWLIHLLYHSSELNTEDIPLLPPPSLLNLEHWTHSILSGICPPFSLPTPTMSKLEREIALGCSLAHIDLLQRCPENRIYLVYEMVFTGIIFSLYFCKYLHWHELLRVINFNPLYPCTVFVSLYDLL